MTFNSLELNSIVMNGIKLYWNSILYHLMEFYCIEWVIIEWHSSGLECSWIASKGIWIGIYSLHGAGLNFIMNPIDLNQAYVKWLWHELNQIRFEYKLSLNSIKVTFNCVELNCIVICGIKLYGNSILYCLMEFYWIEWVIIEWYSCVSPSEKGAFGTYLDGMEYNGAELPMECMYMGYSIV